MKTFDQSQMGEVLVRAAVFLLCLSPLVGLGTIAARNREIENAGRMQQGRLNSLHNSWGGVQFRLDGAYQMLAAARVNEATAIGEASKAMAATDVANKQAAVNRLEQEAKRYEERIAAQVASFVPPSQNGRQTILWTCVVMLMAGAVYVAGRWQDITTWPKSAQLIEQ